MDTTRHRKHVLKQHSRLSNHKDQDHNQNKGQKLFEQSAPREKSTPEEHQETNGNHGVLLHTKDLHVHLVQSVRHVRVTIVTANIVHPSSVLRVGLVNGGVPLFFGYEHLFDGYSERTCRGAKGHPAVVTDIIGTAKVADHALAVGYASVTNNWKEPSNGRERRPDNAKSQIFVSDCVAARGRTFVRFVTVVQDKG